MLHVGQQGSLTSLCLDSGHKVIHLFQLTNTLNTLFSLLLNYNVLMFTLEKNQSDIVVVQCLPQWSSPSPSGTDPVSFELQIEYLWSFHILLET